VLRQSVPAAAHPPGVTGPAIEGSTLGARLPTTGSSNTQPIASAGTEHPPLHGPSAPHLGYGVGSTVTARSSRFCSAAGSALKKSSPVSFKSPNCLGRSR
jgi:hypothetical protein